MRSIAIFYVMDTRALTIGNRTGSCLALGKTIIPWSDLGGLSFYIGPGRLKNRLEPLFPETLGKGLPPLENRFKGKG